MLGFGPSGFGPTPSPRAETQTSWWRFGVAAATVGYEPVGIRPTSWNFLALRPPDFFLPFPLCLAATWAVDSRSFFPFYLPGGFPASPQRFF